MSELGAKYATDLLIKQNSLITALWGIYIVATFTGGSFSLQNDNLAVGSLIAVSLGFWAFALGHLTFVIMVIRSSRKIHDDLRRFLETEDAKRSPFKNSFEGVANTTNSLRVSVPIHLFIDICVTLLIWRCKLPQVFLA